MKNPKPVALNAARSKCVAPDFSKIRVNSDWSDVQSKLLTCTALRSAMVSLGRLLALPKHEVKTDVGWFPKMDDVPEYFDISDCIGVDIPEVLKDYVKDFLQEVEQDAHKRSRVVVLDTGPEYVGMVFSVDRIEVSVRPTIYQDHVLVRLASVVHYTSY